MRSFFLFLTAFVTLVIYGQKAIVRLEVNTKKANVGQEISVTVKSNLEGSIDIEFPSGYVNGYAVMNGMEQEMDYNTGTVYTIYYFSQSGSFKKEGNYTIGPAYIKKGRKVYKSNTVSIAINKEQVDNTNGEVSARQLNLPAFGVIEVNKTKIYEGEALVVNAKIYSKFAPSRIEDYQGYKLQQSLDKHELSSGMQLLAKKETVKGCLYYVISYDRNLVFPSGSGNLQIDPFKLILRKNYEGIPVISTGSVVKIEPLPNGAPNSFIGMVGELQVASSYTGSCSAKGDILNMELVFTGIGNLHNMDYPKLVLPKGMIAYGKPKVQEDFSFTSKGAEGRVILNYTIQSTNDEEKKMSDQRFTYFDPKSSKYITLVTNGFQAKGISAKNIHSGETKFLKHKDSSSTKVSKHAKLKTKNYQSYLYLGVGTIVLLSLAMALFMFFKPAKKIKSPTKVNVTKQYTWTDSENLIQQDPTNLQQIIKALKIAICLKLAIPFSNTTSQIIAQCESKFTPEMCATTCLLLNQLEAANYGMNLSEVSIEELSQEVRLHIEQLKNS